MPSTGCDPGAVIFVAKWFKDCLYSTRDYIGFIFGVASICCWIVAQFPQLYANMKNQSVEALSPWFLAEWLLGDTCNLTGCLLTGDQLPTTTYTAMYFICVDVCMSTQYIYYTAMHRQRQRHLEHQHRRRSRRIGHHAHTSQHPQPADEERGAINDGADPPVSSSRGPTSSTLRTATANSARLMASVGLVMLAWDKVPLLPHDGSLQRALIGGGRRLASFAISSESRPAWAKVAGKGIGWVSTGFYLSSRLAQIYKNWQRKNTDGLSSAMFLCAISANCCYGLGILTRTYSWAELMMSLPWVLGSLGTVALDITIFTQGRLYQRRAEREDEAKRERQPLLAQ